MSHHDQLRCIMLLKKIFSNDHTGLIVVRGDRTVCRDVICDSGIYHNDLYPPVPCLGQHIRKAVCICRCYHKRRDPQIQKLPDLGGLSPTVKRRIPEDHAVPFCLYPVSYFLTDDRIKLIIHGHIAGSDKPCIPLLLQGKIPSPEEKEKKRCQYYHITDSHYACPEKSVSFFHSSFLKIKVSA